MDISPIQSWTAGAHEKQHFLWAPVDSYTNIPGVIRVSILASLASSPITFATKYHFYNSQHKKQDQRSFAITINKYW